MLFILVLVFLKYFDTYTEQKPIFILFASPGINNIHSYQLFILLGMEAPMYIDMKLDMYTEYI